jgi:hypothetical protein
MRGDRRWAQRDGAGGGGDGAGCCARPGHVRGRGGPSSLRRALRLHQLSHRTGLEWVLQMGVRQAHNLPPRKRLHARLRQAGDPRRHAATPARLSLPDPVLAKRGRRHLRQPTQMRPPPRGDPLLRDGVGAHPRRAHALLTVCGGRGLASWPTCRTSSSSTSRARLASCSPSASWQTPRTSRRRARTRGPEASPASVRESALRSSPCKSATLVFRSMATHIRDAATVALRGCQRDHNEPSKAVLLSIPSRLSECWVRRWLSGKPPASSLDPS